MCLVARQMTKCDTGYWCSGFEAHDEGVKTNYYYMTTIHVAEALFSK